MVDLNRYYSAGMNNTLLIKNISGVSYASPYVKIFEKTLIDRWYLGDFLSADYTFVSSFDAYNKEIIKSTIVATVDLAKIIIYSRLSTRTELIDLDAVVNESYVDVFIKLKKEKLQGLDVTYRVEYFNNPNPL